MFFAKLYYCILQFVFYRMQFLCNSYFPGQFIFSRVILGIFFSHVRTNPHITRTYVTTYKNNSIESTLYKKEYFLHNCMFRNENTLPVRIHNFLKYVFVPRCKDLCTFCNKTLYAYLFYVLIYIFEKNLQIK